METSWHKAQRLSFRRVLSTGTNDNISGIGSIWQALCEHMKGRKGLRITEVRSAATCRKVGRRLPGKAIAILELSQKNVCI